MAASEKAKCPKDCKENLKASKTKRSIQHWVPVSYCLLCDPSLEGAGSGEMQRQLAQTPEDSVQKLFIIKGSGVFMGGREIKLPQEHL